MYVWRLLYICGKRQAARRWLNFQLNAFDDKQTKWQTSITLFFAVYFYHMQIELCICWKDVLSFIFIVSRVSGSMCHMSNKSEWWGGGPDANKLQLSNWPLDGQLGFYIIQEFWCGRLLYVSHSLIWVWCLHKIQQMNFMKSIQQTCRKHQIRN